MVTSGRPLCQGDARGNFALVGLEHSEGLEAFADITRCHLSLGILNDRIICAGLCQVALSAQNRRNTGPTSIQVLQHAT